MTDNPCDHEVRFTWKVLLNLAERDPRQASFFQARSTFQLINTALKHARDERSGLVPAVAACNATRAGHHSAKSPELGLLAAWGTTPVAAARSKILLRYRRSHPGSTCRSSQPPRGWFGRRLCWETAHAVAGEQPHPHIEVGCPADTSVEQALAFQSATTNDYCWLSGRTRSCTAAAPVPAPAQGRAGARIAVYGGARHRP